MDKLGAVPLDDGVLFSIISIIYLFNKLLLTHYQALRRHRENLMHITQWKKLVLPGDSNTITFRKWQNQWREWK